MTQPPNPQALAEKHFPGNESMQQKLIDAIRLVQSTRRGWILDPHRRVPRVLPSAEVNT